MSNKLSQYNFYEMLANHDPELEEAIAARVITKLANKAKKLKATGGFAGRKGGGVGGKVKSGKLDRKDLIGKKTDHEKARGLSKRGGWTRGKGEKIHKDSTTLAPGPAKAAQQNLKRRLKSKLNMGYDPEEQGELKMSKAPQHDLYERIGKVTIDGRTKAYKDVVARLQNAAEIRQQRKDTAARSQGNSDGHTPPDVPPTTTEESATTTTNNNEGLAAKAASAATSAAAGAISGYVAGRAAKVAHKKIKDTEKGGKLLKKYDINDGVDEEKTKDAIVNRVMELLKNKGIDEKDAKESVAGAALRFVAKRPKGVAAAAAGVAAGRASQRHSDRQGK